MAATAAVSLDSDVQPMALAWHPNDDAVLATSYVDGMLCIHRCSTAQRGTNGTADSAAAVLTSKLTPHTESCRAVHYFPSGTMICSGSADKALAVVDCEAGKVVRKLDGAHGTGVSAVLCIDACCAMSGDDNGEIKVWDTRNKGAAVAALTHHTDYISTLLLRCDASSSSQNAAQHGSIIAASGDGTLSIIDGRKYKCTARTEDDADDELLSAAVVKGGKKVVVGCQSGVINLYSWGYFNDCSDRFPGHPESVQSIVKYDEDTVFTGSSDGMIRILNILPNKLLGVLGEHSEDPIETLAMSCGRSMLASASHDCTVKIWDLSVLEDDDDNDDDEDTEDDDEEGGNVHDDVTAQQAAPESSQPSTSKQHESDNDATKPAQQSDADDDDDNDHDESDGDDDGPGKKRKLKKKRERTRMKGQANPTQKKRQNNAAFFSDLL